MRILLAVDGSPSAEAACRLTGSLPLPSGSVVHVVGVSDPDDDWGSTPEEEVVRAVQAAMQSLESCGVIARRLVLKGRPASLLVDVAGDLGVELIIVGSRGRGPLASMLLGSVSAEVVDHAPCPVLVARGPDATSALVAVDGSTASRAAVTYLASTRLLTGWRLEAFSVAPRRARPNPGLLAPIAGIGPVIGQGEDSESRAHAEMHAAFAAEQLQRSGHDARCSISTGDPAHEILSASTAFGVGLIVMGSRGLTGLSRLVLGSVARNVLLHSKASVLIVHEPLREDDAIRLRARKPAVAATPD